MNKVHLGDWLSNNLPDKSIDVIMADPPYFEVKGDFDFIWKSFDDYLKDVEKWAIECKRVLKDNGSLFWWGHAKKIAYAQVIFDKYFNLENSLVWRKTDSMQYQYYSPELARSFNTHTERCLFYSNEISQTGREFIEKEYIAPKNPFSIYLKEEFAKAKITNKEISKLFPSKTGGLTGCVSNWLNGDNVITEDQYLIIRAYLNGEYLRKEYEELRKEYEELRKEYEELRRPFNNVLKLEDVITQSQQSQITKKYKHDTQKSLTLIKKLLQTTTSPKHNKVLIPFGGSGTDVEACIDLGLDYECWEIDEKHYNTIKTREKKALEQPMLFDVRTE